jgi:hypothetical protein
MKPIGLPNGNPASPTGVSMSSHFRQVHLL